MSEISTDEFEAPFVVTLKGGTGFEKPWIVIRGNSAAEAVARLAEAKLEGLLEKTAEYAADFQAKNGAASPAGDHRSPSGGSSTQTRTTGAAGSSGAAPQTHPEGLKCGKCQGTVAYKEIKAKSGKTFKLWVCENQRERNDGHHSEFIN